ncbi:MAG: hypothetical protein HZA46_21125 [Planctomycetales bacterium]|nr:hypothetical protein [Planctomycetales bacterium]
MIAGLLAITAISGWGLFKRREYQTAKEQAAIQRIEAVGGTVEMMAEYPWHDIFPNWMLRWNFIQLSALDQSYGYPHKVSFKHVPVTDEEFRTLRIEDLPSVSRLVISKTKMTGQSLIEIAKLPGLEKVTLFNVDITDGDLQHLSGFHSLRSLSLRGTNVRGQCLEQLAILLPDLKYLDLDDTPVSDDVLHCFRQFASLTDLSLCGTEITEEGFKELQEVSGLRELNLARVKSTNSENMRALFETLRKCRIVFSDWSNPCQQCGCSAIREFDPYRGDRGFFFCRHVQKEEYSP